MVERVYLDWNATAPLRAEARDAMLAAMDVVGNPSSVHAEGRAAKAIVERARGQVAALVGCRSADVVFTSGATEAAALAVPEFATLSSSGVEHDAVAKWVQIDGVDLRYLLDVDQTGQLNGLAGGQPLSEKVWDDMVAAQAANSETGVLQDTAQFAEELRALDRSILVLVDAVQAVGKVPFSFPWSGADYAMISAHKLGGPKGVGALLVKAGRETAPRIKGGGQELGRRSGTENVVGIAGFGAACEAAQRDLDNGVWDEVEKLRNILETALASEAKDTIFVGKDAPRLPNTSCFATPGWKGETQVMQMDLAGFAVSSGSACSSGKVKVPRVLRAMGLDDRTAEGALRVSLGPTNTEDEVLRFAETWLKHEKRFRQRAA
ncbi:MAG: cysteine desulfurase family protein [Paracoccaceae bacterium]